MSACEYFPRTSVQAWNFDQPFSKAKQPVRRQAKDGYHPLKKVAAVTYVKQSTPEAFAGPGCHTLSHGYTSHGSLVASNRRLLDLSALPETVYDSADMEHRNKAPKVTLPPLSSLTASIDLDRGHEPISNRYRDINLPSEAVSSRDGATLHLGEQSSDQRPGGSYQFQDRRWSIDTGSARNQRPGSAAYPSLVYDFSGVPPTPACPPTNVPALYHSRSPKPPTGASRRVNESSRPRSYSSPHRHGLHNLSRRTSLADAFELDQLLEALIYIQDINRRLGLSTGRPASPSIFQASGAAEMLGNKVREELDTMALFSQSRADSVVNHLGLSAFFVPTRREPHSSSGQQHKSPVPLSSSVRAGSGPWPPADSAERTQSSMGRLTLNEQNRSELDSKSPRFAIDAEYEEPRNRAVPGASANFSRPLRADPLQRTISRAVSFEHPRATPYLHRGTHYTGEGPAELSRYELETRTPSEGGLGPTFGPALAAPMYQIESRHQQQMEFLDRRRLAGKGMKRVRKRKNEHHQECLGCQAKETPEWRKGPMGPRTLCNACGLLYAKLTKRKLQEAEAAAKASGKTAEEIVREREESPGAKQASLEALRAELNLANGMRNRATLPIAPLANLPQGSHSGIPAFQASRFYDTHIKSAPQGQLWPSQHRDALPPFAHQPPHNRPSIGNPPSEQRPTESTIRPYSSGSRSAAAHRYSDEPHVRPTSGRASSVDHVDRFGPGIPQHRPESPESSKVQGHVMPGPSQQRRHHPYL